MSLDPKLEELFAELLNSFHQRKAISRKICNCWIEIYCQPQAQVLGTDWGDNFIEDIKSILAEDIEASDDEIRSVEELVALYRVRATRLEDDNRSNG